jgi:phosphatidylserine/phosphatidylglycerophosphate/cardiolipin synthase-like enzyme
MSRYVSYYFSPSNNTAETLIGFIDRCKISIDAAIYSITHDDITKALIRAHNRGVKIRILVDNTQAGSPYADDELLLETGVILKRDKKTGLMHHKFIIGDADAVGTGSFNWTVNAARRNAENFVIIRLKYVVSGFKKEFNNIWRNS